MHLIVGSLVFWQIANSLYNKRKSSIPPLFNVAKVLCTASDKTKLLAETFPEKTFLDDSDSTLPVNSEIMKYTCNSRAG